MMGIDKFKKVKYNLSCSEKLHHGLVAQLGAHHIRIVGVGSSNLLKSTKKVQIRTLCS